MKYLVENVDSNSGFIAFHEPTEMMEYI